MPAACLAALWLEWRVGSERATLVIEGFKMGFRRLQNLPKSHAGSQIKIVGTPDERADGRSRTPDHGTVVDHDTAMLLSLTLSPNKPGLPRLYPKFKI